MSNLEPNVSMGQRIRRIAENAIETSKGLFVFALLFVDDTETEENFVCLVKVLIILEISIFSSEGDSGMTHSCPYEGQKRKLPRHGRENHTDHRGYQYHTRVLDPPCRYMSST